MTTTNKFTSIRNRAKRFSAMQVAMSDKDAVYTSVMGVTPYDTSVGWFPLGYRTQTAGNFARLPVDVWCLTATPNYANGSLLNPNVGLGLYNVDRTVADSNASTFTLYTKSITSGATVSSSGLAVENYVAPTTTDYEKIYPGAKGLHQWTHVKMNLYGVRKRATRFIVQLVQLKNAFADFQYAADTNTEKKQLFDFLSRPLMFNNLQHGNPKTARFFKILKTFECMISPTMLDEYGGETAAVPHIQTLNWFIRHNRVRRYDWKGSAVPTPDSTVPRLDTDSGFQIQSDVQPGTRLYLIVRALSPEARATTAFDSSVPADPVSEPSYDMVLRHKWML